MMTQPVERPTRRYGVGTLTTDEYRHQPGPQPDWTEGWYLDFAAPDESIGGFVRLGLVPHEGRAWYWAYLVGRGRPLVAVRDHDVPPPRGRALEVRAEGLWSELVCETPLEHWTVGLEAFGVALDDPLEAYRGERGDPTALGLDLEWEATAAPWRPFPDVDRYEQPCAVHGEVLVGAERIAFEGSGHRHHSWGPPRWWSSGSSWAAGHLDDGTAFAALQLDHGQAAAAAPAPVEPVTVETETTPEGLARRAGLRLGERRLDLRPLAHAPVAVAAADGGASRLVRALCRVEADDGRRGVGWTEWPAG